MLSSNDAATEVRRLIDLCEELRFIGDYNTTFCLLRGLTHHETNLAVKKALLGEFLQFRVHSN